MATDNANSAAEATAKFKEVFAKPIASTGLRAFSTVTASAMDLFEAVRNELGTHFPEWEDAHLDGVAQNVVQRIFRDFT